MKKNITLGNLFLIFFKIGFFTFGGGYAMIPIFQREISAKRKWISRDEIIDLFTIAQSVPGAVAVNTSILIGYKLKNKKGALVTTLGIVLPSYIVITLIAMFFSTIQHNIYVKYTFRGINAAVVSLILVACISTFKSGIKDKFAFILLLAAIIVMLVFKLNPVYLIFFGLAAGSLMFFLFPEKMKAKFENEKSGRNSKEADDE